MAQVKRVISYLPGYLEAAIRTAILVSDHKIRCRIPRLETALALQYSGILNVCRDAAQRLLDACEFSWMVRHSFDEGRHTIDMVWLEELGELVWHEGGGEEIVRFVEQAKAGKVPNPNA